MRKVLQWGVACLAACSMGAFAAEPVKTPAPAAVPVIEHAGYSFCANEANDAMALGRMVMVFKRSREQITADPALPPYVRSMAADLFRDIDEGGLPTYAHFATRRFLGCLESQQVPFRPDEEQAFACLTRVDIPYFYSLLKQQGQSREAAISKLQQALAGWRYPEALIPLLAEPSWQARDLKEVRGIQLFLMSSCLLPAAEVAAFYGAPLPAAEAKAGGKGGAARAERTAPAAPASPAAGKVAPRQGQAR